MASAKRQTPKQVQNKLKQAKAFAKSPYKTGFEVEVNVAANKGTYNRASKMTPKQLAAAKAMQKQRATEMGRAATRAGRTPRKMNALDAAISSGKTLPSKNTRIPGDSDVGMKGFSKKPVIKVKKK